MEPKIIKKAAFSLFGRSLRMSLKENQTRALWSSFRKELKPILGSKKVDFYSVEKYESLSYFSSFNADRTFEKWATIEKGIAPSLEKDLAELKIESGLYAVFNYKGLPNAVHQVYTYILGEWLPHSKYRLDNRPHLAKMGEKYQNNSVDSEEELWIPIIQIK